MKNESNASISKNGISSTETRYKYQPSNYHFVLKVWDRVSVDLQPRRAHCPFPRWYNSEYGAAAEWHWERKSEDSDKNLPQCHFVHRKPYADYSRAVANFRGDQPALWHGPHKVLTRCYQQPDDLGVGTGVASKAYTCEITCEVTG